MSNTENWRAYRVVVPITSTMLDDEHGITLIIERIRGILAAEQQPINMRQVTQFMGFIAKPGDFAPPGYDPGGKYPIMLVIDIHYLPDLSTEGDTHEH